MILPQELKMSVYAPPSPRVQIHQLLCKKFCYRCQIAVKSSRNSRSSNHSDIITSQNKTGSQFKLSGQHSFFLEEYLTVYILTSCCFCSIYVQTTWVQFSCDVLFLTTFSSDNVLIHALGLLFRFLITEPCVRVVLNITNNDNFCETIQVHSHINNY